MTVKTLIKIPILVLACFGFLPKVQAVSPPPDGGYPGANTAEGDGALLGVTTGAFNTAAGFLALGGNTTGSFNTALGAGTLLVNQVGSNTAIGAGALLSNTIGFGNTANGAFALFSNTTGLTNVANGYQALLSNTTGGRNTAIGTGALLSNTIGTENTATGLGALATNATGVANTANGVNALVANATGSGNIDAVYGTVVELRAKADRPLTKAWISYRPQPTGAHIATCLAPLGATDIGNAMTALGANALAFNTAGHGNTALGDGAGSSVTTASNVICLGSLGANVTNSCFIGNIRGITTANNNAIPVLVDSAGQLGTLSSSLRYKTDIKPMDKASESILALKPVSFRYKVHNDTTPQYGLIAEQVAEVDPNLVVRDKNGEIYTVRYDAVNAMLLNEFLKEHQALVEETHKVEQQGAMIARQQEQIDALTAGLHKVSAQLELSKSTPQTVLNSQ